MKKMTKQLEDLLVKMGFDEIEIVRNPYVNKRYEKHYGVLGQTIVEEVVGDDEKDTKVTWWVEFNDNGEMDNEMLTDYDLRGQTIMEHRQAMQDLFDNLVIIGNVIK